MSELTTALQHGTFAWFYIPSALLLGALHGLEPGHSKTMMAAFIAATRGTVGQSILLALSATVSHTAIVWVVALGGLALGQRWFSEADEPWFRLASALLVIGVGLWMIVSRFHRAAQHHDHQHHDHPHDHPHEHHDDHDDAHMAAHAAEIARLQSGKPVSNGQIVVFGLTGGLVPCAAAVTVLLLCLQTRQLILGAVLVLAFSIGLALTLSASGVLAAIGMQQAARHIPHFDSLMRRAPYAASLVTLGLGLFLAGSALLELNA
jgi:nickel/cobalt exporter